MWPGYFAEELHIGYVTNGVHYPTWAAPQWKHLYESELEPGNSHVNIVVLRRLNVGGTLLLHIPEGIQILHRWNYRKVIVGRR